jgi:hypothetical protein
MPGQYGPDAGRCARLRVFALTLFGGIVAVVDVLRTRKRQTGL